MRFSHESRFAFQGRPDYDVKLESAGTHGAVVRQGKALCVFRKTDTPDEDRADGATVEGSWVLLGGRPGVFRAAARHLTASGV
jgi:hypothetical protein